jgi:hypothetical protein
MVNGHDPATVGINTAGNQGMWALSPIWGAEKRRWVESNVNLTTIALIGQMGMAHKTLRLRVRTGSRFLSRSLHVRGLMNVGTCACGAGFALLHSGKADGKSGFMLRAERG